MIKVASIVAIISLAIIVLALIVVVGGGRGRK